MLQRHAATYVFDGTIPPLAGTNLVPSPKVAVRDTEVILYWWLLMVTLGTKTFSFRKRPIFWCLREVLYGLQG